VRKRNFKLSTLHAFFKLEEDPQPGTSLETKSLHYAMVEKDQCRVLTVVLKNFLVWASNISKLM